MQHSHQAPFSCDTAFSDAPRRRGNFAGTSAGDGGSTVLTLFKTIMDYTKLGYKLFCSFNICRSKSNLLKPAVPFSPVSKYLNVKKVGGGGKKKKK